MLEKLNNNVYLFQVKSYSGMWN